MGAVPGSPLDKCKEANAGGMCAEMVIPHRYDIDVLGADQHDRQYKTLQAQVNLSEGGEGSEYVRILARPGDAVREDRIGAPPEVSFGGFQGDRLLPKSSPPSELLSEPLQK